MIFNKKAVLKISEISYSKKAPRNFFEFHIEFLLKVVPTTFLLVRFVWLKENALEARKKVFYFTSKALFVLEIIRF